MSNIIFKLLKDKNNQSEFTQIVQILPDKERNKINQYFNGKVLMKIH
ncbi:hypothetical protein MNU44_11955 (plasmid) [Staphylococcus epidermidis]|jgi:hypothetical protein|nr:hypothetical protein [Staphylococcus epidermidis]UTF20331.1 hypothetical protein MNU44_11955 [Staphylococcus epidermidis]